MHELLVESLVKTSQVFSVMGRIELATLQESAIQLLGGLILDEIPLLHVNELDAKQSSLSVLELGLDAQRVVETLQCVQAAAWIGNQSGNTVLVQQICDEMDWEALPVVLQNFVTQAQLPCHMVLAVEQLELDGDDQYRHQVLPYIGMITRVKGGLVPAFGLATQALRDDAIRDEISTLEVVTAAMEPFMRLVMSYVVQSQKEAVTHG